jgi:polyisoprenoid-binding protein YceI
MRIAWPAWILIALQAPAILPVGTFQIEPGGARVEFVMRDNRGGFTGATEQVEGTATVTPMGAESFSASVEARVDARTLETGNRIRDAQMRRDFLHTDRHPFIALRGVAAGTGRLTGGTVRAALRGTLTIRGTAREIEMPVVATVLADEYRVAGEVTIRLTEYGIPIPRFLVFVAEDTVTVRVRARFRRAP